MFKLSAKVKKGNAIIATTDFDNNNFTFELEQGDGFIKGVIKAKKDMTMKEFKLTCDRVFDNDDIFFANGYQSWTTTREYSKYNVCKSINPIANNIGGFVKNICAFYSDYNWEDNYNKIGCFHSYTYTYFRKKGSRDITLYASKSERQGWTSFMVDMQNNLFTIKKDIDGLVLSAGQEYPVFDIVVINDLFDNAFDKYFFDVLGVKKPRVDHLAGYTSWYNYFAKINEDIIIRDLNGLDEAKECTDIFQIDDGYQAATGDWLITDKTKFPRGMKYIADQIHAKGYKAGIWLAPFCAQRTSKVAKEHPDWLITDSKGKKIMGQMGWGGSYILDIYNPEARAYIKEFFDVILNDWGYDMVKLDFLYTQCLYPRAGKTRGEIMCDAVDFLREACGDKLILGCGVPLGACMGIFDACRIGCDVDKDWVMPILRKFNVNNETPSAPNSITNAIFRNHLDGRAFCNDPDVFFLRDINTSFTKEQKLLLGKINAVCGNVLFVSDNVGGYTPEAMEYLKDFFDNKDYKIKSVEYVGVDTVQLDFCENGVDKSLELNIKTGESNIYDVL